MTQSPDHLPECLVPDFHNARWVCICNQLRACEKRAREDEQAHNFSPEIHWAGMAEAYQRGLAVRKAGWPEYALISSWLMVILLNAWAWTR